MDDVEAQRRPALFPPPFASSWGDDELGLWATLEVAGKGRTAKQKLRWIEPGTFWMGSPVDEPLRAAREGPRHLVTLTEGFWLADTTCTQALWAGVMGNNPSHFKGEQLPVENVSWQDVQAFLRTLEERCATDFVLPTEAQWEYACRAGTLTPFSFGANLTLGEVNYNRNPDAGGVKRKYRERTVEVASLPPNPWGLYEMHGNVCEWCADGLRQYGSEPVIDPVGPSDDAHRAVRGGSWFGDAGFARSACRGRAAPGLRFGDLGVRLCSRSRKISRDG